MDMEEDDSMEIDETMPAAPIIERRSDDFTPTNTSLSEKDHSSQNIGAILEPTTNLNAEKAPVQSSENVLATTPNQPEKNKTGDKQVDVVILDDDDDEPMKNANGTVCTYKLKLDVFTKFFF